MKRRIPVMATAVAATAMLMGAGVSTASAAPTPAQGDLSVQGGKCTYKGYDGWGFGEIVTRKGKGSDKYHNGFTYHGKKQSLQLSTGRIHDRSAATLNFPKKGDSVWVTISHDKGKTWKSCGHKTAKNGGDRITSKKYLHSSGDVKNRYMRACAKSSGKVWCADIGNKSNRNHSDGKKRYWWTDN